MNITNKGSIFSVQAMNFKKNIKINLPDNLNGSEPISGSGANLGPKWKGWKPWCLVLDRGSLGPSTVTFIAFWYVATWGGDVASIIVKVNDLPVKKKENIMLAH